MIITIDLTQLFALVPYLLLGFGFGMAFYYMFYSDNSETELDRKKHDISVKKEWFRMLAERNKQNANQNKWSSTRRA